MSNDTLDQPIRKNSEPQLRPIAIKFGIIAGFVGILISIMLYFANLEFSNVLKWLPTIFMIGIIIIGQQQMAKSNSNYLISFGTLFKAGMIISLITAIFMTIYFIIYVNFIEPNFIDKVLDISRSEMEKKGLGEEQIEVAIEMTSKFMSPVFMSIMGFISNIVIGAIASLIGAAIFKNEK